MATTPADARIASRSPQEQPSSGGHYDTETFLLTLGGSTAAAVAAVAAFALV